MTTTKNLILAAVAALALGAGAVQAQTQPTNSNWTGYVPGQAATAPSNAGQVQSGSSDPESFGADHSATFILNHHLYGAGGSAG